MLDNISLNFYKNRKIVCENIKNKIREKGYTYKSFSKKFKISDDQIKCFFNIETVDTTYFLYMLPKFMKCLEMKTEELFVESAVQNEVLDFIDRRFSKYNLQECFTAQNCYYFAVILKERFSGEICYVSKIGHFVCKIGENYYDLNGIFNPEEDEPISFEKIKNFDNLWYDRLIRDCVN